MCSTARVDDVTKSVGYEAGFDVMFTHVGQPLDADQPDFWWVAFAR
ncbi:hypothetical protein AF72_04110 [Xylella taiwanensis]|uniref:Uncharacterized protein n=1 Tax=Xylella taiwanensis TaxID=1444770 RepID=Z9JLQ4_9GAMM|nr:hypothetical protein AF72_04110 [Xylella taiwanensis]